MEKFSKVTGVAAPLPMVNIDTDKIIPKQFLKTIKRTGLSKGLFYELRYDEDGRPKDDFVLDQPAYREAQILIEQWRRHYKQVRPHSALGYRPPAPEMIVPMDQRPIMN